MGIINDFSSFHQMYQTRTPQASRRVILRLVQTNLWSNQGSDPPFANSRNELCTPARMKIFFPFLVPSASLSS
jgi:hypothetical protein